MFWSCYSNETSLINSTINYGFTLLELMFSFIYDTHFRPPILATNLQNIIMIFIMYLWNEWGCLSRVVENIIFRRHGQPQLHIWNCSLPFTISLSLKAFCFLFCLLLCCLTPKDSSQICLSSSQLYVNIHHLNCTIMFAFCVM